jgi:alcohol dehydrogenase
MIAVHIESGRVSVREAAVPARPPGHALLRLALAGICNTDLELQRGYYAFAGIPGHEFVATVVECDDRKLLNKRVVGEINIRCGKCDMCAEFRYRHCRNRSVLGILNHPGAFSEFFTLPEVNLHVVPEEVSDSEAVFVEPLAAARGVLDSVSVNTGEYVAVLGDGKLGLLITQVLLDEGLRVTLYGKHESKLKIARDAGAKIGYSYYLPKAECRLVVECTGTAAGLKAAISMMEPRGILVMKSTVHGEVSIDTAQLVVNEIILVGSRCGRFEPAIELLREGKVNVKPMISAKFALRDAEAAFKEAARPGVLKVLLDPTA